MGNFINWWQHLPENINPNIITLGSFQLRYYSLMYLVAFATIYCLCLYRIKKEKAEFTKEIIQDYFFWAIFGVIIGGRIGYVLFYNFSYYLSNPLEIIFPFDIKNGFRYTGIYGMSYHGGLIGVLLATLMFRRKHKINFWRFSDFFAVIVPLGYTFGRIGNFINGELYGRTTNFILGMYFPQAATYQLRHPSQLYEAFFEGIFLFLILWNIRKKLFFSGAFMSFYLIGYGILRFFTEFFREPDLQLGFVLGALTMGQILCLAMILAGFIIFLVRRKIPCL